ncbi:MAG: S8 family peptidase [Thermoleophilia bacterium]
MLLLAVLALAALPSLCAGAPAVQRVLVKIDPASTPAERAEVRDALDATAVAPLMAGWRVYELSRPLPVARARSLVDGADAVLDVTPDARARPLAAPNDPGYSGQWALPRIGAPAGWEMAAGAQPVVVAVIDGGVRYDHADLAARMWTNAREVPGNGLDDDGNGYVDDVRGWDFVGADGDPRPADNTDRHGTHVAGIIAAQRDNGIGVAGIADNARIMPIRFISSGGGDVSAGIAGLRYAVANGARVANLSWGSDTYVPALCDAVADATAAGVVVVAAAGNEGRDNDARPMWPASCPATDLITVASTGASGSQDALSPFSSYGATSVDLGAPGDDILSTIPGGYGLLSGTSMAAPLVSGVAAVVRGRHPGLAAWQVREALLAGGTPLPSLAGRTVSGRLVNLPGALSVAGTGVVDAVPPEPFALSAPSDGQIVTTAQPSFSWTPYGDALSGVRAQRLDVDGATVATVGPGVREAAAPAPLAEGRHSWTVVAVDAASNARDGGTRSLIVDLSPPQAAVPVAPGQGGRPAGPRIVLRWRPGADAGSGVSGQALVIDDVPVATLSPDVDRHAVSLPGGSHSWRVDTTDRAGRTTAGAVAVFGVVAPLRIGAARARAGARPVVRVRLARAARVTLRVSRGSRTVARLARRLPGGASSVTLSAGAVRRLAPGRYRLAATAPGMPRATAALVLRRR